MTRKGVTKQADEHTQSDWEKKHGYTPRVILDVLRTGIKEKDWDKVKYVEGLLNMHTIDVVFKED